MRLMLVTFSMRAVCGVLVAVAVMLAEPANAASPEVKARAEELYREGAADFKAERYGEASDKFQQAYNLDPSPILLFNLGRAKELSGDAESAISYFQQYRDQGGRDDRVEQYVKDADKGIRKEETRRELADA